MRAIPAEADQAGENKNPAARSKTQYLWRI
jgi:hypothetical protein